MVTDVEWDTMKKTIRAFTKEQEGVVAIGSRGKINKVFSMSKKKDGKPLTLELLRDYYKELSSVTLAERIIKYSLREDRADGLIRRLYDEVKG